ncbi:4Fe-4S ferredoxin iron-sulfur binding domain protein [Methanohalobium evestigatum Z-7303]|uniref:4Fe-4S ferredoxin iron-sulfur binding domain protein n=1 Tax=Methanohalobium evestigatum (strain ATCC BAA-1072 / DSM 3721 / NBRC 107634 / OCM 161 / Z-7303) TaxID=644295 RepID=D7EAB8_METEZ|nr:4Fe-4S binding protein [Methanohalobium evestigatum]ADI74789.1 4Fe-4S ferredoxin iron-sulfur binding domain protein [Methanohalobium evestigatum Z-7303]
MAKGKKNNKVLEMEESHCIGCGICFSVCPINAKLEKKDEFDPDDENLAIRVVNGKALINEETCIVCGTCTKHCPIGVLSVKKLESAEA